MELSKKQILIVDDAAENLKLFYGLLKNDYKVSVASSGEAALKFISAGNSPDLILLDVMMPGLNGHEVCKQLRLNENLSHVPIIFLTGKSGEEDEKKGFEAGGSDYLTKPVSYDILRARVSTHLAAKDYADMLIDKTEYLESEVARRVQELGAIQDVTIQVMASLAETRDNETGGHIRRTQHYVKLLCTYLRKSPKYRGIMSKTQPENRS
jgi:putative two-component system response regulator